MWIARNNAEWRNAKVPHQVEHMSPSKEPQSKKPLIREERLSAAWSELTLILGFFARIDTKLSVMLGINLGMLGLLGSRVPEFSQVSWWMGLLAVAFVLPLVASFCHLWRGAFPDRRGGTNSLVYFGSIARMSESHFRDSFSAQSPEALADDLLNQVWRNAKIVDQKFASLCRAYVATLLAVLPWFVILVMLREKLAA